MPMWEFTHCIITTWKALGLLPCAAQAVMTHLIEKCVISAQAWVLAKVEPN